MKKEAGIRNLLDKITSLNYEVCIIFYLLRDSFFYEIPQGERHITKTELPGIGTVINGCKKYNTNRVLIAHNHPVANNYCIPSPTNDDLRTTFKYQNSLSQYNIRLIDHIIVSSFGWYSFKKKFTGFPGTR